MSLPPNQILEQKVTKVTLSEPPKTPFNFELSVCVHRHFANPQMFGQYLGYKGVCSVKLRILSKYILALNFFGSQEGFILSLKPTRGIRGPENSYVLTFGKK